MRWSKLKSLVQERFAPAVAGRVEIFSTRYATCHCGRAWITLDGDQVANFCTDLKYQVEKGWKPPPSLPLGFGEFSRHDAYAACWAFVHELSIDQALCDDDPLVQALAVLDARVGRRKLRSIAWRRLHPIAQALLRVRLRAEQIPVPRSLPDPLKPLRRRNSRLRIVRSQP